MQDNPFKNTDVNSIYDSVDYPEVISYCKEQKEQFLDTITWYEKNKFSNPIVNILGNTGSGKTFLLYSLTREFHRKIKGFFIEISPLDIVEEKNVGKLTEYIWKEIDLFFTKKLFSDDLQYRPIDLFVYKMYEKIRLEAKEKEITICYRYFLVRHKEVPIYRSFSDFLREFKIHKYKERILTCIFEQEEESSLLVWLKNKFLKQQAKIDDSYKIIKELTNYAVLFGVPIILVCDQFESLEKSDYRKPIGIFFTQLLELVRKLKEHNSITTPLFVNILNEIFVDTLAHHIKTRMPSLPNGQDYIFVDKNFNKEKALEVAKVYLQRNNQHENEFHPFTRDEIAEHYDMYSSVGTCDIRTWLIHCRRVWDVRFCGAKIFWETSPEPNTAAGRTHKENDITQYEETQSVESQAEVTPQEEQKSEPTVQEKKPNVDKVEVQSLNDICHSALRQSFLSILKLYQDKPEKLLELLYVFVNSLKQELSFSNISLPERDYFCFNRSEKKIYIFFTTKSNRGKGFLTAWDDFKTCINKKENYLIKCIRCKNEDVPNRKEFRLLQPNNRKSHYYCFDIDSLDHDWLKYLYGTIYLLGNQKQLDVYNLPKINYSGIIWKYIHSENIHENVLRYLQESFLKGIL